MNAGRTLVLLLLAGLVPAWAGGARYLVITHDDFAAAIRPLAEWRTRQGLPATIVKLSAIPAAERPPTAKDIRNFIVDACSTWSPAPEFILLVGDQSRIPPARTDPCWTDNDYGNIDVHYTAELPVGRFPCRTVDECAWMVAKTLGYERTPELTDTLWYRRGLVAVRFDNSADTVGYYVRDLRFATNTMRAAGFVVDSLFWRDSLDRFPTGWHGQGPDSARHIEAAVRAGRGLVLYRGHGGGDEYYQGWIYPMGAHPESLENGLKLPVVIGGCCHSVFAMPDIGVGEAWLRQRPEGVPRVTAGAVGYIGNSVSALAAAWRSKLIHGFFKSVLADSNLSLGRAFTWAKDSLYRWTAFHPHPDTSDDSLARYLEWSLMGDPALSIRTTPPRRMQAEYPASISLGAHTMTVTVRDAGSAHPIRGALVCVRKGGETYDYGTTDSLGRATLDVHARTPGACSVVVTGGNRLLFEGTCPAVPVAHDVSCTAIGVSSFSPVCSVYNYGSSIETYQVRFRLGAPPGSDCPVTVASHLPWTYRHILLPGSQLYPGIWFARCSTELATDEFPDNDRDSAFLTVGQPVESLPSEILPPDDPGRVSVRPNPGSGALLIHYDLPLAGVARLDLLTPAGRRMLTLTARDGRFRITGLQPGIYLARIRFREWTIRRSLVVVGER